MRFVLAIVLFVASLVTIGLGIAQRTIFLGPDHVTHQVTVTGGAPVTVIDGDVLNTHPGTQTVTASGVGDIFMAYGRTDDVLAWVGDASAATIGYDAEKLELIATASTGSETTLPSAEGSDLWLQEFSGSDELIRKISVPKDVSLLIMGDGTTSAPPSITITWPLDNSTPWSGPLIVSGVVALLAGLIVLMWALIHARRRRGPRRKTPKMPKPPKPAQLKPAPRRKAITAGAGAAVSDRGRRRAFTALPIVLVGALALSACTTEPMPLADEPTATQSPAPEVVPPVVTANQFTRILKEIGQTVTEADAEGDAEVAALRMTGPALEVRTANYKARKANSDIDAVPAFPTGAVRLVLPQQVHDWPRVVFAAVAGSESAEYAMMLVQNSPREQYKVSYLVRVTQSVPEVAPASLGAARLAPDSKLLAYTPAQLAAEYGDLLIKGEESEFAEHFDPTDDLLLEKFGAKYKADRRKELKTAKVSFASSVGEQEPYAFATNDTGAIVAVDLRETETVKPAEAGAAINPKGAVKALSGRQQTTKGIRAEYGLQMLFYVPPLTAEDQRIRVLGFTQALVAASEVR